jgi:hypothetical protein
VCTGVSAPQRRVDDLLVGHVREHLSAPDIVAQLEREATLLLTDRGRQGDGRRELGQRVAALEAEARWLTDALAAVGISPMLVERLRATEAEIDAQNALRRARLWPPYFGRPRRRADRIERFRPGTGVGFAGSERRVKDSARKCDP